jgi:hypothetical protein
MVLSLLSSPAIMSSLAFVIELLKLSISQTSLSRTPARSHHTENSTLAYILQGLRMPSIEQDRCAMLGHPAAVMVHLAVAAWSRMIQATVVRVVGAGAAVGVVAEVVAEVVRSQKRAVTGAEQSEVPLERRP